MASTALDDLEEAHNAALVLYYELSRLPYSLLPLYRLHATEVVPNSVVRILKAYRSHAALNRVSNEIALARGSAEPVRVANARSISCHSAMFSLARVILEIVQNVVGADYMFHPDGCFARDYHFNEEEQAALIHPDNIPMLADQLDANNLKGISGIGPTLHLEYLRTKERLTDGPESGKAASEPGTTNNEPESAPSPRLPAPSQPEATGTASKRSTVKGEARAKIIAALTEHHKYQDGGCPNLEPIGVRELARKADVAGSSVTDFFNSEFNNGDKGGHKKYIRVCQKPSDLAASLKLLNGEISPHHLFGRNPPGEGARDDED